MLLIRVLNMSLTAGYCILAVLIVRLLLRRAPKKYSYLLWLVVAFRLCCPVSLSSPGSLFNLAFFDREVADGYTMDYLEKDVVMQPDPQLATGLTASSWQSGSGSHGNGMTVSPVLPAQPENGRETRPLKIPLPQGEESNSVTPMQIWIAVGTLLWLTGMGVMIFCGAASYLLLRRRLRNAVALREDIYQSERAASPFILGFWRPRIYIPYGLEEQTLELVLAHERFHLRRRDHWVKLFAYLLLSLHWFNPLCWAAFLLMSRDMEMSCDEHVLGEIQHSCKPYCNALLGFAVNRHHLSPSPLAFGESGAKERICNALHWKKPGIIVKAVGVCLCILTITTCGLNPSASASAPDMENGSAAMGDMTTGASGEKNNGVLPGDAEADMAVPAPDMENPDTEKQSESEGFILWWPLGMTDHTWYEEALQEARAGQRVLEHTGIDFYGVEQVLLEPSWETEELAVHVECFDLTYDQTGTEALPVWQNDYVLQRQNKGFRINITGAGQGIYEKLSGAGREIRISFSHEGAEYLIQGTIPLQGSEQKAPDVSEPGTAQHLQGLIRSAEDHSMVIDEKKLISVGDERWEEWAALWDPEDISGGMAVIDKSTPDLLAPVSEDCRITILENHWQPEREIGWEELLSYIEECPWHMLWNFTIEEGRITEISEQYLP